MPDNKKNKNKGFSEPRSKTNRDMNPPKNVGEKTPSAALEAALASVEKMDKKTH